MPPENDARVLVIDDSLTVRKLAESALAHRGGVAVDLAEDGAGGLEAARARRPDLIFLDYVLPDLPTRTICQELLGGDTAGVPIVLVSSNGNAVRALCAEVENVVDFLTKPFHPGALVAQVEQHLGRGRGDGGGGGVAGEDAGGAGDGGAPPRAGGGARWLCPGPEVVDLAGEPGFGGQRPPSAETDTGNPRTPRAEAGTTPAAPAAPAPATPPPPVAAPRPPAAAEPAPPGLASPGRPASPPVEPAGGGGNNPRRALAAELRQAAGAGERAAFKLVRPGETVTVFLAAGRVVAIASDCPELYLSGARFPTGEIPAEARAEAEDAQRLDGTPYFVTLHRLGYIREHSWLVAFLAAQGERSFVRAWAGPEMAFHREPLPALPIYATRVALDLPPAQLLLCGLRETATWSVVEGAVGGVTSTVRRAPAPTTDLRLDPAEREVLASLPFGEARSIGAVAVSSRLDPAEVARALYALGGAGLVEVTPSAAPPSRPAAPPAPRSNRQQITSN